MPERIRMTHPKHHLPANIYSDFDWVQQHEEELLGKYGECSIIVYEKTVIGVGATYDEALADAEAHIPSDTSEITPIHAMLYHRHPILLLRTDSISSQIPD
jgi:hypothetical protein